MKLILTLCALLSYSDFIAATTNYQKIHEIVVTCFPTLLDTLISVKDLKGGLSGTSLYKIEAGSKNYMRSRQIYQRSIFIISLG